MNRILSRLVAPAIVLGLMLPAVAQDVVDPVDPLEDQALRQEAAAQFDEALDTFKEAFSTAVEQAGQGGEARKKNLARAELLLEKLGRLSETTTRQSETREYLDGIDGEKLGPVLRDYVKWHRARYALAGGDTAGADTLLASIGLVNDWWVLGPFDNERGSGFRASGPAESGIDFAGEWKGKERQVKWRQVPVKHRFGYVDLNAMLRPNDQAYAYAVAFVRSDTARPAALRLGSDEAVKAWWNGAEVLSRDLRREIAFDQDVVGVQLGQGWNKLLVKIHDQTGSWGFRVRLTDEKGEALQGVTFATSQEDAQAALDGAAEAAPFEGELEDGAKGFFDAVTEGGAASSRDYFHLGLLHHLRGFDSHADRKAETLLKKAAELDPENPVVQFHYAQAASPPTELAVEKEENKQRLAREKALEIDPRYAVAYRALATYYTKSLVNLERAEQLLRKALEVNPDYLEARFDLASLLSRRGQTAEAALERRKALDNPRAATLERAARNRAAKLQGESRGKEAMDAWKQVLSMDARSNDVRRRMVDLAAAALEPAEAHTMLDAIIEISPFGNRARARKAELFEGVSNWKDAERMLREALAVCPEDDGLLQSLARVQRKAGEEEAALVTLRRALEVNPKLQQVERYVNYLDPESAPFEDAFEVDVMPLVEAARNYENPDNDATLYLLDQGVNKVNPDGTAGAYTRLTVKILNERGVKQYQRHVPRVWGGMAFKWKYARVIREDGSIVEGKKSSRGRFRTVSFPALEVGDVVDIAYRADDRQQGVFGDYYGTSFLFASNVPMKRSEFTLITPADREFYFHQRNLDVQPEVVLDEEAKTRTYTWRVADAMKVNPEGRMPQPRELYPQVEVSTYKDWDTFATWWWSLIRDQHIASDEIKQKVAELIEGKETRFDKIRAIYDFVTTDITYQAWPFGPHGYKPYTTTAIFDKREGDCKDKAILIDTMLREIGVEAYPVLIRGEPGRSKEDLTLAMVGHFNHCISYVPDVDGEGNGLFLDGTATYHSAVLPPMMDRGAEVVVITPDGAKRMTVPLGTPEQNGVDQDLTIELNDDGSAKVSGRINFRGDVAVQIRQVFSVEGQRPIILQRILAQLFGEATLVDSKFDDLRDLSGVDAGFELTAEVAQFAQKEGESFILRTNFLDGFKDQAGMATRPAREHDMILGVPQLITLKVKYVLPEGWTVESLPEDAEISTADLGTYHSKAVHEGNALTLDRAMRLTATRVPAQIYPAFRDALNQLSSVSAQQFKVKPGNDGE